MKFDTILAASAVGALAFSSGALAAGGRALTEDDHAPEVNTARAKCTVLAIGYSEVSNKEAIATASADAFGYICNGETIKTASDIAADTAEAFALAVASASVACELEGDAMVQVDASASAVAAAKVWVAAYAEAFAGAGDCDQCDAYATSFGYIEQEVFLKAVAEASIWLEAYTTAQGPALYFSVLDYQKELKRVVATAFSIALANAAEFKKASQCLAWVNLGGCIWTPDSPEGPDVCFECTASAVGQGTIEEIDALSRAYLSAAAWTCGTSVAIVDATVTASALAEATAVAVSFAFAECKVDDGFACAIASSEVEKIAKAVADAYASLWAGAFASEKCLDNLTCEVSIDSVAKAVGTVLVKASTDAFAAVCAEKGYWTDVDLDIKIKEASLCALAEASVFAISAAPSTCIAGGITYAGAEDSTCPPPAGY